MDVILIEIFPFDSLPLPLPLPSDWLSLYIKQSQPPTRCEQHNKITEQRGQHERGSDLNINISMFLLKQTL